MRQIADRPIKIADYERFMLTTLESATGRLIHRELLQNAIEASVADGETERRIYYYVETSSPVASENNKITLINSGVGMSAQELAAAADMASNIGGKDIGSSGRKNRGEGAKISCIPYNRLGIRYRSRKNGVINEVTLRWVDRVPTLMWYEHDNGEEHDYKPVDMTSLTDDERYFYSLMDGDFTEVRLYGNTEGQNTATNPYGDSNSFGLAVPSEIFNRFYAFRDIGIPISLKFRGKDFFAPEKDFREFVTMSDITTNHSDEFEASPEDRIVTLSNGIKLEYLKTIKEDKNSSPWSSHSIAQNGGRIAIEWMGELYEVATGSSWGGMASSFGFFSLASSMTAIIHLPGDFNVIDGRYREHLSQNGRMVTRDDFKNDVVNFRPQWLLDILAKRMSTTDDNEVENRLTKLAEMLYAAGAKDASLIVDPATAADENVLKMDFSQSKSNDSDQTNKTTDSHADNVTIVTSDNRANTGRITMGNRGKKKTNCPLIPKIMWVKEGDSFDDQIKGYGASFTGMAANLLILNQSYPHLASIERKVVEEFGSMLMNEEMAAIISRWVRDQIKFNVGYSVSVGLVNSQLGKWNDSELTEVLSRRMLSIVYQMTTADAKNIARAVKENEGFKEAKQRFDASLKSNSSKAA